MNHLRILCNNKKEGKEMNMKHWTKTMLEGALALGLAFSLTGCGSSTNSNPPAAAAPAETSAAAAPAETSAPAESTAETPEGKYTSHGLENGDFIISGEGLSGLKIDLEEGGGGTLNFSENNAGPITSWRVDNGKFTMKAGVSDFTGTWENGVLHLDLGDNTVLTFLKEGAPAPANKVVTLDEYKALIDSGAATADGKSLSGTVDSSLAGEYKVYAVESNGSCIRIPEGDMVFTFNLKEDGTGTVTVEEDTEKLVWKNDGEVLNFFETDGSPSTDKYKMTIKDGIIRLEVPATEESGVIIEYFVRDGADVSSINAKDPS